MSDDDDDTDNGEEADPTLAYIGGRRNWNESFEALLDYKKIYGNTLVPSAYDNDTALGHWVRKQRRNESCGKLSPARRKKLDDIGFVWKLRGDQYSGQKSNPLPKKRTWAESFEVLKDYKKTKGDCNVPRRYGKDMALGQWVSKQRLNQAKLSKKQRDKLISIGFEFELTKGKPEKMWQDRYERLQAYQEQFGDCEVPYKYKPDPDLGIWVEEQRRAYLEERITPEHTKALEALGFQFVTEDDDDAEEEKNEKETTTADYQKSSPTPTPARVTMAEKWGVQYDNLVAFYEKYGHCQVSRPVNKQLSYWVQRQRQLNLQNKLKPERKLLLDELNFEWYTGVNVTHEQYFSEMMQRLSEFQAENGHVNVPPNYMKGGLGEWVQGIKQQGEEGHLPPDEAEQLLRTGFTWTEHRSSWFKHYDRVCDEIEDCRRGELMFSRRLERWLKVQFLLLEYDLLMPKRVEKMEELDVEWDGEALSWKDSDEADNVLTDNRESDEDIYSTGVLFKAAAMAWSPDGEMNNAPTAVDAQEKREEDDIDISQVPTPTSDVKKGDGVATEEPKDVAQDEPAPGEVSMGQGKQPDDGTTNEGETTPATQTEKDGPVPNDNKGLLDQEAKPGTTDDGNTAQGSEVSPQPESAEPDATVTEEKGSPNPDTTNDDDDKATDLGKQSQEMISDASNMQTKDDETPASQQLKRQNPHLEETGEAAPAGDGSAAGEPAQKRAKTEDEPKEAVVGVEED